MDIFPLEQRRVYWDRQLPAGLSELVSFKGLWSFGVELTGSAFDRLTRIALDVLWQTLAAEGVPCKSNTLDGIVAALNGTERIRVSRDYDMLTALECELVELLKPLGLLDGITGMEFPINVRVVHGRAPSDYLSRRYPTDILHSDLWSNEPNDIINGVLYLGGDITHTFMRLFECGIAESEPIASFRGQYGDQPRFIDRLEEIETSPRPGLLIIMDGVCPHQTRRQDGGVRLSLDFRLRRADPYCVIDERWMQPQQAFARYWRLNPGTLRTFTSKCRYEREALSGPPLAARDQSIAALLEDGTH